MAVVPIEPAVKQVLEKTCSLFGRLAQTDSFALAVIWLRTSHSSL